MHYVDLNYNNKDIKFEVNKNDFIEYLWEQKTGKLFRYVAYIIDDPNSKIYKQIENDWLNNNIDEHSILQDYKFIDFIIRKYDDELYELIKSEDGKFVDDENLNYINSLVEEDK